MLYHTHRSGVAGHLHTSSAGKRHHCRLLPSEQSAPVESHAGVHHLHLPLSHHIILAICPPHHTIPDICTSHPVWLCFVCSRLPRVCIPQQNIVCQIGAPSGISPDCCCQQQQYTQPEANCSAVEPLSRHMPLVCAEVTLHA